MANLKKIIDLPELTAVTGDETVVGTSDDGATVRIPVKNISGASLDELANLNELEEAVGDETVIGVSNGSVVRIPVDAIGGSVDPMLLRDRGTSSFGGGIVYPDGSSVTITDIYNAFMAGIPIIVGNTGSDSSQDENHYPKKGGTFAKVISVDRSNLKISVIIGTEVKQFSIA